MRLLRHNSSQKREGKKKKIKNLESEKGKREREREREDETPNFKRRCSCRRRTATARRKKQPVIFTEPELTCVTGWSAAGHDWQVYWCGAGWDDKDGLILGGVWERGVAAAGEEKGYSNSTVSPSDSSRAVWKLFIVFTVAYSNRMDAWNVHSLLGGWVRLLWMAVAPGKCVFPLQGCHIIGGWAEQMRPWGSMGASLDPSNLAARPLQKR